MNKIYLVGGPTSSGKTEFAIKLAIKLNAELINADSRQIYKYLDIGTNKGKLYEINKELSNNGTFLIDVKNNIPIHLINFINPDIKFSVYDFYTKASQLIKDIYSRNKNVIIVGGTGLYIDSLIKGYNYTSNSFINEIDEIDETSIKKLKDEVSLLIKNNQDLRLLENVDLNIIQSLLLKYIPKHFNELNNSERNNKRRLVRIIEKIFEGNVTNSVNSENVVFNYSKFYYPIFNFNDLKLKITGRVDEMFKQGLVSEVENIIKLGYNTNCVALKGIGYREVVMFLKNEIDLNTCIELVKQSHIKYAKRQITWFEGEGRGYILNKVSFK